MLIGTGLGLAWGHTLVFRADQNKHPTHIAVYFYGYYFSYQLGIAFTLYVVSPKTTDDNEVLVSLGLSGCCLSFMAFVAGTPFYQPEFTKHLEDPFVCLLKQLAFNWRYRQSRDVLDNNSKSRNPPSPPKKPIDTLIIIKLKLLCERSMFHKVQQILLDMQRLTKKHVFFP